MKRTQCPNSSRANLDSSADANSLTNNLSNKINTIGSGRIRHKTDLKSLLINEPGIANDSLKNTFDFLQSQNCSLSDHKTSSSHSSRTLAGSTNFATEHGLQGSSKNANYSSESVLCSQDRSFRDDSNVNFDRNIQVSPITDLQINSLKQCKQQEKLTPVKKRKCPGPAGLLPKLVSVVKTAHYFHFKSHAMT